MRMTGGSPIFRSMSFQTRTSARRNMTRVVAWSTLLPLGRCDYSCFSAIVLTTKTGRHHFWPRWVSDLPTALQRGCAVRESGLDWTPGCRAQPITKLEPAAHWLPDSVHCEVSTQAGGWLRFAR